MHRVFACETERILFMNSVIIKEGVDSFFDRSFMRYDPKIYNADIDDVTYASVSKGEAFKDYLLKDYKNFNTGKGMLQFYVFYAVCALGCCDMLMIERFLKNLSVQGDLEPVLSNPNRDKVRSSLQRFTSQGLLLRHHFIPEGGGDSIALYLPTQTGLMLLKNAMQKEGTKEIFTPVMPPFRLLGKAVSTYVALELISIYKNYQPKFRNGLFSTFVGGHLFMNNMLELEDDRGSFLLGTTDLFMDFQNSNYLVGDSDWFLDQRVMLIEQFKHYARSMGSKPKTIVCVSDMDEIQHFLIRLFKKKNSDAIITEVYFTTEMAFKAELPRKFLIAYQNDFGTYEIAPSDLL
jgi:hypothetical protein